MASPVLRQKLKKTCIVMSYAHKTDVTNCIVTNLVPILARQKGCNCLGNLPVDKRQKNIHQNAYVITLLTKDYFNRNCSPVELTWYHSSLATPVSSFCLLLYLERLS